MFKRVLIFRNFSLLKQVKHTQHKFHSRINSLSQIVKTKSEISFKEIQIPIEGGYIAAKEYGPPSGNKLIAVHGWQDNAGSFDPLISLLSPNLHIIALDRAGHGLSTHKPPGHSYYYWDFVNQIKIIADFLKWEKFSILGHSVGSTFALLFASVFPERVNKIVGIDDVLHYIIYPSESFTEKMKYGIEQHTKFEEKLKNEPPHYSEDEMIKLLIEGRHNAISTEGAKILMKRGIKRLPDGKVSLSRDIRIKHVWDNGLVCKDVLITIISNIKCDLLLIKGKESVFNFENENLNELLKLYKTKCKTFKIAEVKGNHFVHLNNPECVASIINSFILNT